VTFGQQFLDQIDASAQDFTFPFLDHGFYSAIDVRLHVYRDDKHWAVVIETVGFNPKARSVTDALTGYGIRAGSQLNRVENIADLIDDDENYVGGVPIRVRGRDLAVEAPSGEYFAEVVRDLVPEHRDLLLADESELRALVPRTFRRSSAWRPGTTPTSWSSARAARRCSSSWRRCSTPATRTTTARRRPRTRTGRTGRSRGTLRR